MKVLLKLSFFFSPICFTELCIRKRENRLHLSIERALCIRFALSLHLKSVRNGSQETPKYAGFTRTLFIKIKKSKGMYKKEQKKMAEELERIRTQLRQSNHALLMVRRELGKTKHQLAKTESDLEEARRVTDGQERVMKRLLDKWLTKRSLHRADQMLRTYRPEDRLKMLYAMMQYVQTGRKTKFERPVMEWHQQLFCEMVDEDRVTVPSHALLKRLWVKIGLLKSIDDGQ